MSETLRIQRSRLTTGTFKADDGSRCALGWWIAARGGKTPIELGGNDAFVDQNLRIFADLRERLGIEGANRWSMKVIQANNYLRGRERESVLRGLFAQVGVRVVFTGRTNG